jgi:hypothetical protein
VTSEFARRERLERKLREMEASLAGMPLPPETKPRKPPEDVTYDDWHSAWDDTLTKRVRRQVVQMETALLQHGVLVEPYTPGAQTWDGVVERKEFDPDQPRDEQGRWTSGGGGGEGGPRTGAPTGVYFQGGGAAGGPNAQDLSLTYPVRNATGGTLADSVANEAYGEYTSVVGTLQAAFAPRDPALGDSTPIEYANGVTAPYLAVAGVNAKDDWRSDPNNAPVIERVDEQMAKALEADRVTTPLLMQIAKEKDGQLQGLVERVKAPETMAGKIFRTAEKKGIPIEDVETTDNLRYTMTFNTRTYTEDIRSMLGTMRERGFTINDEDMKNTWGGRQAYQGINTDVSTPDGYAFEMQFHTPESFVTKEGQHGDYETMRDMSNPYEQRGEAWDTMASNQDKVPKPPGVLELGTLKFEGRPTKLRFYPRPTIRVAENVLKFV